MCKVEGCNRPNRAHGYCNMHNHRIKNYGDPHFTKYVRHFKCKRTYNVWRAMRRRCEDPSNPHYSNYGGRGITVCERWQSFEAFYADMGQQPSGMTVERIDNDRGYGPDNCRWATRAEQQRNRRNNRLTDADVQEIRERVAAGEMQKDVAEAFGLHAAYVSQIVNYRLWRPIAIRAAA